MQTRLPSFQGAESQNVEKQAAPPQSADHQRIPIWSQVNGPLLQRAGRPQFDARFGEVFNIDDEGVELPQEFWSIFSAYTADTIKFGRLPEDDRESEYGHYSKSKNEIILNYDMYFVKTSDGKDRFIGDPAELFETLLHEGVHARAANYRVEGAQQSVDNFKPTNTEFNQMGQHERMAERGADDGAVDLLYQGLKNFDRMYGLEHSDIWYVSMIFKGSLRQTMTYQMFSADLKGKIDKILENEDIYRKMERTKALLQDARTNGDHSTASSHEAALDSLRLEFDQELFDKSRTASSTVEHKVVFSELPTKAEQLKRMR